MDKRKRITSKYAPIVEIEKKGLGEGRGARAAVGALTQPVRIIETAVKDGITTAANDRFVELDAALDVVTNPTKLAPTETRKTVRKAKQVKGKVKKAERSVKRTSKKLKL